MCTLISLLKQYFLLLITFCTYFERCSNFEFEAIYFSYVIVSKCKWVSGVDTYEAEIAADSIIWELCARKSAECLNLRNSFITTLKERRYLVSGLSAVSKGTGRSAPSKTMLVKEATEAAEVGPDGWFLLASIKTCKGLGNKDLAMYMGEKIKSCLLLPFPTSS